LKEIIDFGRIKIPINLVEGTEILTMKSVPSLKNFSEKIQKHLRNPLDAYPLEKIIYRKLKEKPNARAIIVISDNTRPVPYKGRNGILYPIVREFIKNRFPSNQIRILIATGTHRKMTKRELEEMIDQRIFKLRIPVIQHNWQDKKNLIFLGKTSRKTPVFLNRNYIESDIRILTGLVESHFMAGVSGGRKSICPGLAGEETVKVFHGAEFMSSPMATDLLLNNNPCHEEAVEIAKIIPPELIINITLDRYYKPTGVFIGELEKAHLKAVEKIKSYVAIPVTEKYDLVITHAGFVGVNHYQAAKSAVVASYILKKNGFCILAAHHSDPDPIGGKNYKKLIRILKRKGTQKFLDLISSPSWTFIPEQWQVQMWTRLFKKIPQENLIYCSQEIPLTDFSYLPGINAQLIAPQAKNLQELIEKSIDFIIYYFRKKFKRKPKIAFLADGPYGIPIISK